MTVWMIKSSTGQYSGRVFATKELASIFHESGRNVREILGIDLGAKIVEVKVLEEIK